MARRWHPFRKRLNPWEYARKRRREEEAWQRTKHRTWETIDIPELATVPSGWMPLTLAGPGRYRFRLTPDAPDGEWLRIYETHGTLYVDMPNTDFHPELKHVLAHYPDMIVCLN